MPRLRWARFRDNSSRHLIGVARDLQSRLMDELIHHHGHHGLRMGFEPYFSLLGRDGYRLTAIADLLGITKQACRPVVRELEQLGYLTGIADPNDGRAKRMLLTKQGKLLMRDGQMVLTSIAANYLSLTDQQTMDGFCAALARLAREYALPVRSIDPADHHNSDLLGSHLPRISAWLQNRLMSMTRAKGHPHLSMAFGQVLPMIGPNGSRVSDIARIQNVSKQAISATAHRLQTLGYIKRQHGDDDRLGSRLVFTSAGQQLINDCVDAADTLDSELENRVGEEAMHHCRDAAALLYRNLKLEENLFSAPTHSIPKAHSPKQLIAASGQHTSDSELQTIAQQLRVTLGAQRSLDLANLLQNRNQCERA